MLHLAHGLDFFFGGGHLRNVYMVVKINVLTKRNLDPVST